jgi:hypothetical protein
VKPQATVGLQGIKERPDHHSKFKSAVKKMTDERFSQIEDELNILKKKYELKKITHQEFKDSLKALRFKDDRGRYWTIGVQSGDWYCYDGSSWIKSSPPSLQTGKTICFYCGSENDLQSEFCVNCGGDMDSNAHRCPECGTRLRDDSLECPHCSNKEKFLERQHGFGEESIESDENLEYVIRSLDPFSFLLFWAIMGSISGILLGVFSGVSRSLSTMTQFLPEFLRVLQGKFFGGIVYGLIGGAVGFLLLASVGYLLVVLINAILSLTGGMKLKLFRSG